ncbi:2-polyprenyl-6-methoxyphenol hydroxylase-like FAD-dependent oxidoreductase [Arthrobacter ginsengisoli]|uniref:2-polyprenyl-6-methoxyphenol hydroxylase-like FAD-dependent oxidoreductase n=1 Tax=Arthrobacter ginsengisoli TaxID=1356565 RepID=A0ABU1UA62_9MICC|nr:FAD-dependent monooxygenase [Arthrobacter ginsengisoli]MDR7082083.1 2-polyprenyl-6-methoxyphenol hydroxylase-like FAD-dependent oxidoreductase [Arthrobacter ginsengisoli]
MDVLSVVGGGIAGLALAARLDPRRFQVTVHERREEPPPVETSLAMWPEAQRALDAVGILPAVRTAGSGFGGMVLRDGSGNVLLNAGAPGVIGVSRAALLRLLDAAVPAPVARAYGTVAALPRSDLVVGADGVHSIVRRSVWGERARARLSPYLALRGIIEEPVPSGGGGEYWGRGQLFGITPAARGRTYWYASYRSGLGPGGINVEEALDLTRARFSGRAADVDHVLAAATPRGTLAQRVWTVPYPGSYQRDGAVLVGDAAHGMTPNLGRGACEALIDAVTLADLLNTRPLPEALRAYNRRRLLRSQALRVASSAMARLALAENAQPLRDGLLRLAGRRGGRPGAG